MKKSTIVVLCIGLSLVVLGAIFGGIGLAICDDPLVELNGISIDSTEFFGGRQLDSDFHADGEYELPADITNLDLNWVSGTVTLHPYNGDVIRVTEQADKPLTEENCLRWGVEDGTLYIQYCKKNAGGRLPVKNLEILIPADLALEALFFDGASADLTVQDLTANFIEISSVSGQIDLAQMTCTSADLETTSGAVYYGGAVQWLEVETVSGEITVVPTEAGTALSASTTSGDIKLTGEYLTAAIETVSGLIQSEGNVAIEICELEAASGDIRLTGSLSSVTASSSSGAIYLCSDTALLLVDLDTASGDVDLTIPAGSGFALSYDTASGDLNCQLPLQIQSEGRYLCGDGSGQIGVNTASGDLRIQTQ